MRIDLLALALRWVASWFLLSLVILFLYLVGASQSFLEQTQVDLFRLVRWTSWLGLLGTWVLLVPLCRQRLKRVAAAVILGLGFAALFAFVVVWGAWIYPEVGRLPW